MTFMVGPVIERMIIKRSVLLFFDTLRSHR